MRSTLKKCAGIFKVEAGIKRLSFSPCTLGDDDEICVLVVAMVVKLACYLE